MPNHYVGVGLHTITIYGLSHVRTELLHLAVLAALTPHPVQMHRQLSRYGYFRDLPSSSHGEVKKLAMPLPLTAHRDLRYFDTEFLEENCPKRRCRHVDHSAGRLLVTGWLSVS